MRADLARERVDIALLRLMLQSDGELARPATLASCVVAARLGRLVLAGGLIDDDGRARVLPSSRPLPAELNALIRELEQHPRWDWQMWFWRTGIDADAAYQATIDRLVARGTWMVTTRRWPRRGIDVAAAHTAPVVDELRRLDTVATAPSISGRDALMLHLLAIARAVRWIPLTPALSVDQLERAAGLDDDRRRTLRVVLDALVEVRYRAARGLSSDAVGYGA